MLCLWRSYTRPMKIPALLILLVIQSVFSPVVSAQNLIEQNEIDSLKDIGQIDLLIENLPVVLRSSISDSQLQDECELRLRRGGVPISPKNVDLPKERGQSIYKRKGS